jgi:hypothetical protein
VVKASFRHDVLFVLKHEGKYITLPSEADWSSERKVVEVKLKAYFWLQEQEKARRNEQSFGPFCFFWTTWSQARMENLRQHSMTLNNGKGTALHWFTVETSYQNPHDFFEPIWTPGRAGDEGFHSLLESRMQ